MSRRPAVRVAAMLALAVPASAPLGAQSELPRYLRDRGTGVNTSIFSTFVRRGELLVSPFFEYYVNNGVEYQPSDFGYAGNTVYQGRYRASEGLMFLAYGITDWLAVELEVAAIDASLSKASGDASALPARVSESGPGDMQAQIDVRLLREGENRPEVFGYAEAVFPSNRNKPLIGTPDWEFKGGLGVIRGFGWGTLVARASVQHAREGNQTELGTWAVEYLRRLSSHWRVYGGVEGVQGEVELIGEVQWHPTERLYFRFNTARGLTSKAIDWAPDVGMVFSIPTR